MLLVLVYAPTRSTQGSFDLIHSRMKSRPGHYMQPGMLQSQFDDLEPPEGAIVIDIRMPADQIAEKIIRSLCLKPPGRQQG